MNVSSLRTSKKQLIQLTSCTLVPEKRGCTSGIRTIEMLRILRHGEALVQPNEHEEDDVIGRVAFVTDLSDGQEKVVQSTKNAEQVKELADISVIFPCSLGGWSSVTPVVFQLRALCQSDSEATNVESVELKLKPLQQHHSNSGGDDGDSHELSAVCDALGVRIRCLVKVLSSTGDLLSAILHGASDSVNTLNKNTSASPFQYLHDALERSACGMLSMFEDCPLHTTKDDTTASDQHLLQEAAWKYATSAVHVAMQLKSWVAVGTKARQSGTPEDVHQVSLTDLETLPQLSGFLIRRHNAFCTADATTTDGINTSQEEETDRWAAETEQRVRTLLDGIAEASLNSAPSVVKNADVTNSAVQAILAINEETLNSTTTVVPGTTLSVPQEVRDLLSLMKGIAGAVAEVFPALCTVFKKFFSGLVKMRDMRDSTKRLAVRVGLILELLSEHRVRTQLRENKTTHRLMIRLLGLVEAVSHVTETYEHKGVVRRFIGANDALKELNHLDHCIDRTFGDLLQFSQQHLLLNISEATTTLISEVQRVHDSLHGVHQKLDELLARTTTPAHSATSSVVDLDELQQRTNELQAAERHQLESQEGDDRAVALHDVERSHRTYDVMSLELQLLNARLTSMSPTPPPPSSTPSKEVEHLTVEEADGRLQEEEYLEIVTKEEKEEEVDDTTRQFSLSSRLSATLQALYRKDPRCKKMSVMAGSETIGEFNHLYQATLVAVEGAPTEKDGETRRRLRSGPHSLTAMTDSASSPNKMGETEFTDTMLYQATQRAKPQRVVLVEGPAGMGKSTLLRHAASNQFDINDDVVARSSTSNGKGHPKTAEEACSSSTATNNTPPVILLELVKLLHQIEQLQQQQNKVVERVVVYKDPTSQSSSPSPIGATDSFSSPLMKSEGSFGGSSLLELSVLDAIMMVFPSEHRFNEAVFGGAGAKSHKKDRLLMTFEETVAAIKVTPLLILLDGFDEVATSENPTLRNLMLDILSDPQRRHPDDGVVITSRVERAPALLRGEVNLSKSALCLRIVPWSEAQIFSFCTKYLATLFSRSEFCGGGDVLALDHLVRQGVARVFDIHKQPTISGIAKVPLIFDILCCIAADEILASLPESSDSVAVSPSMLASPPSSMLKPHEIISRAIDMLLHRAARKEGRSFGSCSTTVPFEDQKKTLFSYLEGEAWEMLLDDGRKTLSIDRPEINGLLERCELVEGIRPPQHTHGGSFSMAAAKGEVTSFRFVHTMFLDYFAALRFVRESERLLQQLPPTPCTSSPLLVHGLLSPHVKDVLVEDLQVLLSAQQWSTLLLAGSLLSPSTVAGEGTPFSVVFPSLLREQLDTENFDADEEDMNDTFLVPLFAAMSLTLDNPSMLKDTWAETRRRFKDDIEASSCEHCGATFTFTRRRHHCSRCGGIFCSKCCPKQAERASGAAPQQLRPIRRLCTVCLEGFTVERRHDSSLLLLKHLGTFGHAEGVRILLADIIRSKYCRQVLYEPPDTLQANRGGSDEWDLPTMRPRLVREVYRCAARAASAGHLDVVKLVQKSITELYPVELGAINLELPLGRLMPPIAWAAARGHLRVVQHLHKQCGFKLHDLQTPDGRYLVHLAAQHGHLDVLRYIIQRGEEENTHCQIQEDCSGLQPLHVAAESGHEAILEYLLEECAGVVVDAPSVSKRTPLHSAAEYGRVDAMKLLIDHGANINAMTGQGRSALHIAAEAGQLPIIHFILQLHHCHQETLDVVSCKDEFGLTPLHVAARGGNVAAVRILHQQGNANCSAAGAKGQTPLHLAAFEGHLPVVQYLHRVGGVDLNTACDDGSTALEWAEDDFQDDVVEYLSEFM